MTAGGGFAYVGAMHDSFPQALELSKMGYNAFALIYRPDDPYRDLAQAITYIYDHAVELEVDPGNYSLWGGSAGARMAATLGNAENLRTLTARTDIPQAAAVITQYTGYQSVSASDAPTYACVGTSNSIASARTMQNRLDALQKLGIPTEFHAYENLPHGFGLGTGTAAEGWIQDAVRFWEDQMPDESIPTARQTAIATKFGIGFDKSGGKIPYPLVADARPETIRKSVEGSLKRLGVECIDLYYQHRIDPNTSPEEVADVMAKLIQEGKIRHWGISECDESYLRRAHAVCPVTAIQNRYSMMYRNYEQLFPVLEELGVALVAFSPLANGFLSGRYDANSRFEAGTDYRGTMPQFQAEAVAENQELLAYLHQIAAEKQATPAQIALVWMLCKKPWIIPIPGTRNPERMQENANAADVALSPAEVEKIDAMLDKIPMSAVYGGVATRGNA